MRALPVTDFSTVAALYMEQVQIVTCDPDIKTVADLKGKTVSIGAAGSGVFYNAVDILNAYDLNYETDINAQLSGLRRQRWTPCRTARSTPPSWWPAPPPLAITTLATAKHAYLVSLDDEHIEALKAECPYYEKYVIPADTYEGVPETTTVAVVAVIIARDDVGEDDVYNIVSTIFDNTDTLAHDKAEELDLDFAASVTAVPYHPGAARYFAEKGIEVPTK